MGFYSLCNAHHIRELTRAWEQDKQAWAHEMKQLLEKMNIAVNDALRIGEFPCRLLRTKNHHFAIAPFP
jgi:uncharacterized protein YgfB (UPF0149 family)